MATQLIALVRGEAGAREAADALDQIGVRAGEHFLLVHPDALGQRPNFSGVCICGRSLTREEERSGPG